MGFVKLFNALDIPLKKIMLCANGLIKRSEYGLVGSLVNMVYIGI